jgi:hypothetical protein
MQQMNTPGGYAAIGSIGNAINALAAGSSERAFYAQQTQQLRDQIAYQRRIMEEQIALRAQERIRQQMMAQAAGDAFANSLGKYSNFGDRSSAAGNNIADTFRQILATQAPDVSPQASGPVADRIASASALANERSGADADNLAKVQGVARAFTDSDMAVNRNNQMAAMLGNFAGGSEGASQAEIEARAGRLFQPRLMAPAPSMLGDLFMGLSDMAVQRANRPQAPASPYGLIPEGMRFPGVGLQMDDNPRTGIRLDRPAGLGIRGPNGMRVVGG